jgi:inorganic phosphate transporter, PiT family
LDAAVQLASIATLGALMAIAAGANDGATLTIPSLNVPMVRPIAPALALAASVALCPWLISAEVARTLATGLVTSNGAMTMIIGVASALAVTLALTRTGVPTSLTLALIGGLVGAGIGSGSTPSTPAITVTLTAAALAPPAGATLAMVLAKTASRLPLHWQRGARLRALHLIGITGVSIAYGANDGQKAIAILASANGNFTLTPMALLATAALFLAGAIWGLFRLRRGLQGIGRFSSIDVVSAQLSVTIAVLASTQLGAPVSSTQTMAAALMGTVANRGLARVRWRVAQRIALSWCLTLPAALAVSAATAALISELT